MSRYLPTMQYTKNTNKSNGIIDTHEMMKQELLKQQNDDTHYRFGLNTSNKSNTNQSSMGQSSTKQSSDMMCSPDVTGFIDTSIYFDSTSSDAKSDYVNGEIIWSIPVLNYNQDVKNCIELSIDSFYFPNTSIYTNVPNLFLYKRIYMWCINLPLSQSTACNGNNSFHFEFEIESISNQLVKLIPVRNSYFLKQPIDKITDFIIRFVIPPVINPSVSMWQTIQIPNDTVNIVTLTNGVSGYYPIRFFITGNDTTSVLGPNGNASANPISVYISNFMSGNTMIDGQINSFNGLYVTNIIDANTFEIGAIDGTRISSQVTANMYIPKNRIAFNCRFTSIVDRRTTYIGVHHS